MSKQEENQTETLSDSDINGKVEANTEAKPVKKVRKPRKARKPKRKPVFVEKWGAYWPIANAELYEEICKSLEQEQLTDKANRMLCLLADKCSTKLHYEKEADREDCVQFAIFDLIRYWKNYKPQYKNLCFAYFTQITKKGLAKGWNRLYPKKYKGTISLDIRKDDGEIYSL